jgi:hypothetical protein
MARNSRGFPSLFVDAGPGERTSLVLVPAAKLGLAADQDFLAASAHRLGLGLILRLSGPTLVQPLGTMLGWASLPVEERRRISEIIRPGRPGSDLAKLVAALSGALVGGPAGALLLVGVPQGALLVGAARGALRGIAEEFGEPLGAADRMSQGLRPARHINQRHLAFDDLASLSERSVPRLIRTVGEDRLALALADAAPAVAARLCAPLSRRRRRMLAEQIAAAAECDAARIDAARSELLAVAQDLYDHLELTLE